MVLWKPACTFLLKYMRKSKLDANDLQFYFTIYFKILFV